MDPVVVFPAEWAAAGFKIHATPPTLPFPSGYDVIGTTPDLMVKKSKVVIRFLTSTLSIFYKRQPENVTRVSLKFFKNLPRSVSKSVS